MSTTLGIQAKWLSSEDNKRADDISRKCRNRDGEYDFSQLLTDHPALRRCRKFQPSNFLLGKIWDVLRENGSPDPLMLRKLEPATLGSFISSDS